ncbi:hypothetical protein BT63DRAFT_424963 [Microthyrium microscopicum]|uniref:Copper transporter n=1 Tax=Microthyrium microscopicum TaxID=703497 RepID=A0A6A6UCY1_9PEZI|nr:hypothetical protein BT63DRAFT_424963 [Microthyrium microscopicum]
MTSNTSDIPNILRSTWDLSEFGSLCLHVLVLAGCEFCCLLLTCVLLYNMYNPLAENKIPV